MVISTVPFGLSFISSTNTGLLASALPSMRHFDRLSQGYNAWINASACRDPRRWRRRLTLALLVNPHRGHGTVSFRVVYTLAQKTNSPRRVLQENFAYPQELLGGDELAGRESRLPSLLDEVRLGFLSRVPHTRLTQDQPTRRWKVWTQSGADWPLPPFPSPLDADLSNVGWLPQGPLSL